MFACVVSGDDFIKQPVGKMSKISKATKKKKIFTESTFYDFLFAVTYILLYFYVNLFFNLQKWKTIQTRIQSIFYQMKMWA